MNTNTHTCTYIYKRIYFFHQIWCLPWGKFWGEVCLSTCTCSMEDPVLASWAERWLILPTGLWSPAMVGGSVLFTTNKVAMVFMQMESWSSYEIFFLIIWFIEQGYGTWNFHLIRSHSSMQAATVYMYDVLVTHMNNCLLGHRQIQHQNY